MDWRTRRILDNIWGPIGTTLIHIVVIVFLVRFMVFEERGEQREIEVKVMEVTPPEELEDIEQELEQLEDIPTVVDAVQPPEVDLNQEPPQMDAVSPTANDIASFESLDIMEATSPIVFKNIFRNRSASARGDALDKYSGGMGKSTEYAVIKALNWLRDHQYPDGSWGPHYRGAMTGLALLAFLAHGENTASPDYGRTVQKGLKYLLRHQKDGWFIAGGPRWHRNILPEQIKCYEHAIATYAMSEAYALTQIPFLKYSMEDAIQIIIDGQHAAGSWDYGYPLDAEAHIDVSLSGWHIQALKAASAAGAENRGLKTTIEAAMRGLTATFDETGDGLFRYGSRLREPESDYTMTGVAVLCMQLSGHALDAEARAGIQALRGMDFIWTKTEEEELKEDVRKAGQWPLYAWYYITQARFHQGGGTWIEWNRQFAPNLVNAQNEDGSWCPAPSSREARYGPVYCTTLPCLMLEVYYRLLPTFGEIDVEGADTVEEEAEEDEIIIKFG
jgi:hypothetical protein